MRCEHPCLGNQLPYIHQKASRKVSQQPQIKWIPFLCCKGQRTSFRWPCPCPPVKGPAQNSCVSGAQPGQHPFLLLAHLTTAM